MAWEWVAPVATATTAIAIGGAGIVFTWLTGKQARDHARAIAKEARVEQRLESAYIELLEIAERAGQWAEMAYPVTGTNPVPPLPSLAEQAHSVALLNAVGSPEMLERFEAWLHVVQEMTATAGLIDLEDAGREVREPGDPHPRNVFYDLKPKEANRRRVLQDQVAGELGHRTTD
jgi:hypothetical protein